MDNDTTVPFFNPAFGDEMTELIRAHAQTAIRQAVLAELEAFLGSHDDTDGQGRRNIVRNGYQPEREVLTTAILDRLLHKAHVFNIKCRSYRLRDLEQTLGARQN